MLIGIVIALAAFSVGVLLGRVSMLPELDKANKDVEFEQKKRERLLEQYNAIELRAINADAERDIRRIRLERLDKQITNIHQDVKEILEL